MRLRSSAFSDGETIPRRFTCEGEDTTDASATRTPSVPRALNDKMAKLTESILLC